MTTLVPFLPAANSSPPFSALVTLNGALYTLAVTWQVYSQRWYYSLTDQTGNVVITAALLASPAAVNLYLAPGIFATSTILYRESTGNFEINP